MNPTDVALRLRAADLALALRDVDAARDHYQKALEASPYHPRAAQEAKRKLPPSKWKSLRYLEKPPPVWDTPAAIFTYPYSRGPLYIAVPAVVLAGLLWTVWTAISATVRETSTPTIRMARLLSCWENGGSGGRTTPTDPRAQRNRAGRRDGQLLTRARGSSLNHRPAHSRGPRVPLSRMVAPYAKRPGGDDGHRRYHAGYQRR